MSFTKGLTNLFMLSIATLAITSCVPTATEKKAVCGTNEAFSTVTRSCYSIEETRVKPVGTTSTVTVAEEVPQTITLAYTDGNKDQAVSCRITSISTSLEMLSPSMADGGLLDKADEVYQAVSNLATEISMSETAMRNAILAAKASLYFPTIVSQMTVFKAQAESILSAGAVLASGNTTVNYYYTLGQQRMVTLTSMMNDMTNRCACSGGVCTTVAIPKLHKSGASGFSYAVTDVDGEGAAKATTVNITAMSATTAHLKPTAASAAFEFNESNTSVATSTAFTLPVASDINPTAATSMRYYFGGTKNTSNQGVTTLGKVTGCMDLTGSDGLNDTTCIYTPTSGDTSDTTLLANDAYATVTVGDVVFRALAKGAAANSYTVQYFDLKSDVLAADPYASTLQKFGLVNSSAEAYIRVSGNAVKIFVNPNVTTTTQVVALVNAHAQANRLIVASGGSAANPSPSGLTPSAASLAGGVDGNDKFSYYANNTATSSTNTAVVNIRMKSVDDIPAMNTVAGVLTVLEDVTPISINLSATYTDVDTNHADVPSGVYSNICNIDPLSTIFTNFADGGCTCTALGVCTQVLVPNANVSSATPFTFSYRIGSVSNAGTQYAAYTSFSLTVTPVNDPPEISYVALPTITNVPAQIMSEGGTQYVDVFIGAGGTGPGGTPQWESGQTLTLTAASSNPTLFPSGSITVGDTSPVVAGKKRITFTPATNQSGTSTITLTLKDNGAGTDTTTMTVGMTVNPVNNPPVFRSTITSIHTNEGGAIQSDAFEVDEDAGGSTDENAQSVKIISITSDNHSVLPPSAITIFYDLNDNGVEDLGEARAINDTLEGSLPTDNLKDVNAHKFYLKLDPVDGISGNANITLTIQDTIESNDPLAANVTYLPITNTATTSFSLIVHPIAALHGGWSNIASVGIKTDKLGSPVATAEIQCNYNLKGDLKNCGTASDCKQAYSPNGTVVPTAKNVIFWDSAAKRCYRSTDANNQYSWVDFNTSCPVTRTTVATDECSGNNCITDTAAPYPLNSLIPKVVGQYQYNVNNNKCYVSTATDTNAKWQEFVPSKVTLNWKQMVMVGSGADSAAQISGWNVYRREAGTDYNFKGGHLKYSASSTTASLSTVNYTINDPSIRTFTDTTAIAGKVYYYVVRPVDNLRLFPTHTPEVFSEVRVLAAPTNYAFVHRWMINQEICNSMNITTTTTASQIDQTNNFRCKYSGPGSTTISSVDYYDYGKDLLVDTQEMGCAYAEAPKCSANGCIGIGTPTDTGDLSVGDLYYDRGAGKCYSYVGSNDFQEVENVSITASVLAKMRTALNAPLVNVTQSKAVALCSARSTPSLTGVGFGATALPTKKDFMAYSAQRTDITDPEVTELEQGYSLNIQSRCNGSAASGLETAYTDSSIPSTSFIYSIPGTYSSGIRSLYTGSIPWSSSKGTESCVSRYGVQDLYGNVAEWTRDQVTCSATGANTYNSCTAVTGGSFTGNEFGSGVAYGFNAQSGPYNDIDGSGNINTGDGFLTDWTYSDQLFGANYFSLPLALPIASTIFNSGTGYPGLALINYLLQIGPSSGITSNKLHDDGIIVNNANLSGATASFAVGGSYLSGNRAGRYSSELIKTTDARSDVGLRCIIPINSYSTGDTQYTYPY